MPIYDPKVGEVVVIDGAHVFDGWHRITGTIVSVTGDGVFKQVTFVPSPESYMPEGADRTKPITIDSSALNPVSGHPWFES